MIFRNLKFNIISFIIFAILLQAFASPVAFAKKKKSPRKKSENSFLKKVKIRTDLGILYDDNVINYSDDDLSTYDSQVNPDRFSIKSKDDVIINFGLSPEYSGKLFANRNGSVSLGAYYNFFVNNDVKRYIRFSLRARQHIIKGGYLQLSYGLIPSYYYRNYRPDSAYAEAKFSKHTFGAEIGYDITKYLKVDLSYDLQLKNFNNDFNERDANINSLGLGVVARPVSKLKIWSGYKLEFARADGRHNPDINIVDVSYDAYIFPLGIRYYSGLSRTFKPEFYSEFKFRQTKYQTDKYNPIQNPNTFFFGRNDNNFQIELGSTADIAWGVKANLAYTFQQKISDLPIDSLETALDYTSNLISLKLERAF